MSRRFRLRTLERLRAAAFQDATASVGRARRAQAQAQLSLVALERAVLACVPPPRATPEAVQAAAVHRNLLRERADAARAEVAQADRELQTALELWHRRRSELRAVENLHERHRRHLAETDARREQRQSDDLAATVLRFPGPHVGAVRSGVPSGTAPRGPSGGDAA